MPRGPRPLTKAEILGAFAALGMAAQYVDQKLGTAKDFAEFAKRLEELKEEAKKAWRKLAFDLHPDRGGDEERFKKVAAYHEMIEGLQAGPPPRPRPMPMQGPMIVINMNFGGGFSGFTSTNATTGTNTYTSTGGSWI